MKILVTTWKALYNNLFLKFINLCFVKSEGDKKIKENKMTVSNRNPEEDSFEQIIHDYKTAVKQSNEYTEKAMLKATADFFRKMGIAEDKASDSS